MITGIEGTLYIDPQAQVPVGYCPVCAGALYGKDGVCPRCERRSYDAGGTE